MHASQGWETNVLAPFITKGQSPGEKANAADLDYTEECHGLWRMPWPWSCGQTARLGARF